MSGVEAMTEDEFRGHVKSGARSNFMTNVAINGGLAWWLLSGSETLTPFGAESYGPDLLITGFLLAAIITCIVIATHRGKVAKGELGVPARSGPDWLAAASKWKIWQTTLVAGLVGAAASGALLAAMAVTVGSLSVPAYVVAKALYAGLLAAAVVGPATLIGLRLGAARAAAAAAGSA